MNHEMAACSLAPHCAKQGGEQCTTLCFPWRKLAALREASGIPAAYQGVMLDNLPFKDTNPKAYTLINDYVAQTKQDISCGNGLFIYSKHSRENLRGTGTGKTTAVCCILNEYLCHAVIEQCTTGCVQANIPALFVNASVYQNMYNEQFRGSEAMQAGASAQYYPVKQMAITAPLLALDDVGIRGATEAFRSELYEIIDTRATTGRATLITSNMDLDGVGTVLDERISSRIAAMCRVAQFTGRDHRQKGGVGLIC